MMVVIFRGKMKYIVLEKYRVYLQVYRYFVKVYFMKYPNWGNGQ